MGLRVKRGNAMTLGLEHYSADPEVGAGIDRVLAYTYWNVDGCGIVILAREGYADDWGAYIGALPGGRSEQDAIYFTAAHGAKLTSEQATRWFPKLPTGAYRP